MKIWLCVSLWIQYNILFLLIRLFLLKYLKWFQEFAIQQKQFTCFYDLHMWLTEAKYPPDCLVLYLSKWSIDVGGHLDLFCQSYTSYKFFFFFCQSYNSYTSRYHKSESSEYRALFLCSFWLHRIELYLPEWQF